MMKKTLLSAWYTVKPKKLTNRELFFSGASAALKEVQRCAREQNKEETLESFNSMVEEIWTEFGSQRERQ